MTMIEAMGRIDQIQATLDSLAARQMQRTPDVSTTAGSTAAGSAASGSAATFAEQLSAALGAAPSAGTTAAGGGAAAGASVVAAAEKYLGVPYVFGGEDASGMDCSGLVQRVYADIGIEVPRLVSGQMTIGTEVGSLAEAQPGDLIVTGGGEHILIYAGDNKVIHAPYEGRTVCLVDAYMTDADIDTIRRVVPEGLSSTAGGSALPASAAMPDFIAAALAAYARGVVS